MTLRARLLPAFTVILLLSAVDRLQADVTGSILGTVRDPTGAVVSGATVTLTSVHSGLGFTYNTADDGAYRFSLLPAGSYSLTAEAPTFVTTEISAFELSDGSDHAMNIELHMPQLVESVEINAEAVSVKFSGGGAVAFIEPVEPIVKAAFNQNSRNIDIPQHNKSGPFDSTVVNTQFRN